MMSKKKSNCPKKEAKFFLPEWQRLAQTEICVAKPNSAKLAHKLLKVSLKIV